MTVQEVSWSELLQMPVSEVAAGMPGAAAVFRRFGIDYGCGARQTLSAAMGAQGVAEDALQAAFDALDPDAGALPEETGALIDHILARYHDTHRREMPELARLAAKVEAVHADHPGAPHGLSAALQGMIGELEVHMKKEELILFPMMRRGGAPMIVHPILQMRHDHDDHAEAIARLRLLTGGLRLPEGACRSWQALYAGMAKLIADLERHIEIENVILFPRFDAGPEVA